MKNKLLSSIVLTATMLGCSSCEHINRHLEAASVKFSVNITNDVRLEGEVKEGEKEPENVRPEPKPSAETDAQLREYGKHAFSNIRRHFLEQQAERERLQAAGLVDAEGQPVQENTSPEKQ